MLTAYFPRLFINKKVNSKDNEFEFHFGIVGIAGIQQMQWGDEDVGM